MNFRQRTSLVAREFRKQLAAILLGAFGLIAALAWNDAFNALIDHIFPSGISSLWAKFIYAAVFTLVVVLVSVLILRPPEDKHR
jgi:hypothetical protein